MPSYAEDLIADPPRLRATLVGLIDEHQAARARLAEEMRMARGMLDRAVLKLVFLSQQFGRGASETVLAQREAEDANTRVAGLTQKLEKQEVILRGYHAKLAELDGGGAPMPVAAVEAATAGATMPTGG